MQKKVSEAFSAPRRHAWHAYFWETLLFTPDSRSYFPFHHHRRLARSPPRSPVALYQQGGRAQPIVSYDTNVDGLVAG